MQRWATRSGKSPPFLFLWVCVNDCGWRLSSRSRIVQVLPCVGLSGNSALLLIVITVLEYVTCFWFICTIIVTVYVPSMLSVYVIKRACEIVPALLRLLSFY